MAIHNRESFLNNLAQRLGREVVVEGVKRPDWVHKPQLRVFKDYTREQLIAELEKQCADIHTQFKRTTKDKLHQTLNEVLSTYEAKSIVYAPDERNEHYNLNQYFHGLIKQGIDAYEWDLSDKEQNRKKVEQAHVGLTFSDITLAESGTVTLFNDKNNARTISLLPEKYIAIIQEETLVPRMTQATERLHQEEEKTGRVPSCVSFVTGPSNSADIEMNLIVGVHGPIHVTYIVVD